MFNSQKNLDESISCLNGVGKKRLSLFLKLGLKSCFDLLCHFPTGYFDCSKFSFVEDFVDGKMFCVKAQIVEKFKAFKIKNLIVMKALAADEHGELFHLVFFNSKFLFYSLELSKFYVFFGKVEKAGNELQMVSPKVVSKNEIGLIAKYGLVEKLSHKIFANELRKVFSRFKINENLPQSVVSKFNLVDRNTAFFDIHFPRNEACLKRARRRLIFEELFFWQLGLKLLKKIQIKKTKVVLSSTNLSNFLKLLPFELSSSQVKVIKECVSDCSKPFPMNRLIQGDVGCGKTVIAQALCFLFVLSSFQVALMAPTEVLARQHFNNFRGLFLKLGIEVGLLVGSLKRAEKNLVLNKLSEGTIKVLIGTHSLFSRSTVFNNLGLVITDEQHRFGVLQRSRFVKKGQVPHVLIMSATPVPRTLAMVFFADVDVSIVDRAPAGKAKTKTFHIPPSKRLRAFSFLASEVKKGHQAYIVCPLIDDGKKKAVAVEPYFQALKKVEQFKNLKIEMLHGKQTSEQKIFLMDRFVNGEIDVLVTTSVVEVGIDNGNATVILIENAELFGLASLHQLRGRVGRGRFESFCVLISSAKTEQAKARMKAMCEFEDGFEISKIDLKLRGPGQFFGTLQHGICNFKIVNLFEHLNLFEVCSKEAEKFANGSYELSQVDLQMVNCVEKYVKNRFLVL